MATRSEMGQLRVQLEALRDGLLAGTLQERDVWPVLKRASVMLDESDGTDEFEGNLRVIYTLLSGVWDNIRLQERISRINPST